MDEYLLPKHIAIIPDGNRRYAKKEGKLGYEGHSSGVETLKSLLSWCKEKKIKQVTFWALSTDNLKREKSELTALFKLMESSCDSIIQKKENEFSGAKIRFFGELNSLPEKLQMKLHEVEKSTSNESEYLLNIMIAYGGHAELMHAAKTMAKKVASGELKVDAISDEAFASELYLTESPDLIIRTGHACLSGFLPWQSAYSEVVFLEDKLWPEFSKDDFEFCLSEFAKRKRNYGK